MNCKQGDLAIIVRATNAENLGKIVEVVRPYYGEKMPSIDGLREPRIALELMNEGGVLWVVRSHGSPLVWARYGKPTDTALFRERAFDDACLRPIPKLDEPEEVTTEKELTV